MATTIPTQVPIWNTGGANNADPGAGKKVIGWVFGEEPASSHENWRTKLVGEWLTWVDERVSDGTGGTPEDEFDLLSPDTGNPTIRLSADKVIFTPGGPSDPSLIFDTGDTLDYDRTLNRYNFYVTGVIRSLGDVNGFSTTLGHGIAVGTLPTAGTQLDVGSTSFSMDGNSAVTKILRMGSTFNEIQCDPAPGDWRFAVGPAGGPSVDIFKLDPVDVTIGGDSLVFGGTGDPRATFDTGDYLEYDRASNTFDFYIGTVQIADLSSSTFVMFGGSASTVDAGKMIPRLTSAIGSATPQYQVDNCVNLRVKLNGVTGAVFAGTDFNIIASVRLAAGAYDLFSVVPSNTMVHVGSAEQGVSGAVTIVSAISPGSVPTYPAGNNIRVNTYDTFVAAVADRDFYLIGVGS